MLALLRSTAPGIVRLIGQMSCARVPLHTLSSLLPYYSPPTRTQGHGCIKSMSSTFHGCHICGPVCDVGGGAVVPAASARPSVPSASGPVPGSTIGRAGEASLGRTLSKEVRHIPHTVDGLRKAFDLPFQRLRFVIDK